jgi:hypothetical protein
MKRLDIEAASREPSLRTQRVDLKQMNEFIAKWYTYSGRKIQINWAPKNGDSVSSELKTMLPSRSG